MITHETHLALRAKSLLLVTIVTCAVAAGMLGGATEKASAYWVCSPAAWLWRGPDFRCQHSTYRPTISYIEKNSSNVAYTVYRSAAYGATSISGVEYFSPTNGYYLQSFGCNPGYPNAHNATWGNVAVEYTLAGSC